jgi:signal transduction histidine kinase
VNQGSVLIIADEAAFTRDLVGHWQMEREVPSFVVVSSDLWAAGQGSYCDLAIVDGRELNETRLAAILDRLEAANTITICVVGNEVRFHSVHSQFESVLPLKFGTEWLGALIVLATAALRRMASRDVASTNGHTTDSAHAVLGRFMLEARHGFNNALTSLLGNAELLMMQSEQLPAEMREQVETVHSMALRLHEMMQRFSSLDAEMQCAEKNGGGAPSYVRSAGVLPRSRELREEDSDLR